VVSLGSLSELAVVYMFWRALVRTFSRDRATGR